MGYISGTKVLPAFKRDTRELIPTIESADNFWRASDYNSVRSAMQELLDFARSGGGGVTYPLTLTEPVGSSPTTAFRIVDNIGLETFSIKTDGSFIVSDKGSATFRVDDGFMSPLLTIKQSDHVYTTDRYAVINPTGVDFWPDNGGLAHNGVIYQTGSTSQSGSPGLAKVAVSADNGLTWSVTDIPGYSGVYDHSLVQYAGSFYCIARNFADARVLLTSTDCLSWTPQSELPTGNVSSNLYVTTSGILVYCTLYYPPSINYSTDQGLTWLTAANPSLGDLRGLFCAGNRWVVQTNEYVEGIYHIFYSDDLGVTWNEVSGTPQKLLRWLGSFGDSGVMLFDRYPVSTGVCAVTSDNFASITLGPPLPTGTDVWINTSNLLITSDGYAYYVTSVTGLSTNDYVICLRSSAPINQTFTWLTSSLVAAPLSSSRLIDEFHTIVSPAAGILVAIGHSYNDEYWKFSYSVWSLDGGATWLDSGTVSKLSANEGLLDLGAKYIEFSAENNARYLTLSMDEATNSVFDSVGDIKFQVPQTSLTVTRGSQTHFHDRVTWLSPTGIEFAIDYGVYAAPYAYVLGNGMASSAACCARSSDNGATWGALNQFSPYTISGATTFSAGPGGVCVALLGPAGVLFATSSNGWDWTTHPEDPIGKGAYPALFFSDGNWLYSCNPTTGDFLVSGDFGETWTGTPAYPALTGDFLGNIYNGTIFLANDTQMSYSTDGGDTWSAPVDTASRIVGASGTPLLFHVTYNPGTDNLHFLFAVEGLVHEIYDVQFSADATTFVKVEKFPNGVSIQTSRRLNCSTTGSTVLIPCNGPEANSTGKIVDLTTKAVYEALSEITGSDLRATIWTGTSWICAGHTYWPRDATVRRGLALTSPDGILWGDLLPAVTLLPEGGVLDLYAEKLSICSRAYYEGGSDTQLIDLKFYPNMLSLSGNSETQLTLYGSDSGNTLTINTNVDGYAQYNSVQPHEFTSASLTPLRITLQGDAARYGYFDFRFDNNPVIVVQGGSDPGYKSTSLQLYGYPADATEPNVLSSLYMTGYGWAGAASQMQQFGIQNVAPTDLTSGWWQISSQSSRDQDNRFKFVLGAATPVDIEPLYLNLEGPVSTELLPIQNSTMLHFKAHFWDTADTYYDAGIQYQILDNDPSVLSKLSFQIDGDEVASVDQAGALVVNSISTGGYPAGRKVDVPATPTSAGQPGDFAVNSQWIFFCQSTNLWVRSPTFGVW